MSVEIYNEGRVVGYSAYEVYCRQSLMEDPTREPGTERDWLSASLAMGASLILKVDPSDKLVRDFVLPDKSALRTANTIVASLFIGNCKWVNNWATKVLDYGPGISNTASSHPVSTEKAKDISKNYPNNTNNFQEEVVKVQMNQYMKIRDGLVLQTGDWSKTDSGQPYEDFDPTLPEPSVVRLVFSKPIAKEFYILLTGFTDSIIIQGVAGVAGLSTTEISPQNGDFLGPALYPWANKINFTVPASLAAYLKDNLKIDDSHNKYLKLVKDDDKFEQYLSTSSIITKEGIKITQPTSPAGDITLQVPINSNRNNLKVDQSVNGGTTLTASNIVSGTGTNVLGPSNPAGDITLYNIVRSMNNYLRVAQTTGNGYNNSTATTMLYPSTVTVGPSDWLKKNGPNEPGGSYSIQFDSARLNQELLKLQRKISENNTPIWNCLKNIVKKFYGEGTVNESTGAITWGTGNQKAAIGNINLYAGGGPQSPSYIKTHSSSNIVPGDIQVN